MWQFYINRFCWMYVLFDDNMVGCCYFFFDMFGMGQEFFVYLGQYKVKV